MIAKIDMFKRLTQILTIDLIKYND